MAKRKNDRSATPCTVADVCAALERLAPTQLAQDWDNVGLLAGDCAIPVRRVMLCIDLMPDVLAEALRRRAQLIVAYHPPIFKPIKRLVAPSPETSHDIVFRSIAAGVALYSTHTALDAAEGGTNDVIAGLCGLRDSQPLEYTPGGGNGECKLVTFVPTENVEQVAKAIFEAGAGWIGDYDQCSFRIPGTGTFRGGESTNPVIGQAGNYETVEEIRLEAVTPQRVLPAVVAALRKSHPYEEPPIDIYPLQAEPVRGIGRYGDLPKPTKLATLAKRLKKETGAKGAQIVGDPEANISRAIVCVGAAGSLPFNADLSKGDVVVTGEIRHHDALAIRRHEASAIALGHWASERPVLPSFRDALLKLENRIEVVISEADCDPFAPI